MSSPDAAEDGRRRPRLVLVLLAALCSCARRDAEPRRETGAVAPPPSTEAVERAMELVKAGKLLISRLEAQKESPVASELIENLRGVAEADAAGPSMLDALAKGKMLAYKSDPVSIGGRACRVFLFDPLFKGGPGPRPQTVVVTDDEHGLLTWKEVGGSPVYESARLEKRGDAAVLAVTCRHEHGPRGTYRYALSLEGITRSGDIEWHREDEGGRRP